MFATENEKSIDGLTADVSSPGVEAAFARTIERKDDDASVKLWLRRGRTGSGVSAKGPSGNPLGHLGGALSTRSKFDRDQLLSSAYVHLYRYCDRVVTPHGFALEETRGRKNEE